MRETDGMEQGIDGFLQSIAIFSLLEGDELRAVSAALRKKDLGSGEVLFREGDPGVELFIVQSGKIQAFIVLPSGEELEIARFSPGDFFGDMSIFEDAPRSASCRALEASLLLCLSKDDFHRLMEQHPGIAIKLMYRMLNFTAQRLRSTSGLLSDLVRWGEGARKRAITDEFTGVYNRRFLEDSLEQIVAEARSAGKPLSLFMTDLDRFREINELYGNKIGDEAILGVVRSLKALLREKDIICRFGGDEFVVLLPDTDSIEATRIASSVVEEVSRLPILAHMKGAIRSLTTSMGVASFPRHAPNGKSLRMRADEALYKAKEGGRNRAVCVEDGEGGTVHE